LFSYAYYIRLIIQNITYSVNKKEEWNLELRDCVKNSKAFAALKEVYDNREKEALKWKNSGRKVIGIFGYDVPEEILIAAGFLPIHVYGGKNLDLSVADRYLEYSFDPMLRAQFEKLVDGTYFKLMDYVAISHSSDALVRAFYYLRMIRQVEPEMPVPPIYFVDQFFLRTNTNQMKNWSRFEDFRRTVEVWACKEIPNEEIWKACELCNEDRKLMRQFSEMRYGEDARVTGSEALVAFGSSMFMQKQEHINLMRELVEDAKNWDKVPGKRVFVTGSVHEDTDFYDLVEKLGGNVVCEDHDWGERYADRDVDLTMVTPERALVDRYTMRMPSPKRSLIKDRVKSVVENAKKSGAELAIIYLHMYEDSPSWDCPSLIEGLKEIGVPCLVQSKQPYRLEEKPETAELIANYIKEGI